MRLSIALGLALGCVLPASQSEAKVIARPLGGISTDGTRLIFREAPYSVTVVNAATLAATRIDTPGCNGADIAFSLVLLGCDAPRSFALMRTDTGQIMRRFVLDPDPASDVGPTDSFLVLGKHWALGRRDLGDRTPTIYLNLTTGHVSSVAVRVRATSTTRALRGCQAGRAAPTTCASATYCSSATICGESR